MVERDAADGFRTTAAGRGVLKADVPALATPSIAAKKRKSALLVTQKQVAAVMKSAAQAGVHVEVRIENGVVRFIPCTPEAASPKPNGVTNRSRGFL